MVENIERTEDFRVHEDHLNLFKNMVITWFNCEFGAPSVDPKRPYGNSNVYFDIAKILGIKSDDDGEFTDEQTLYMLKRHKEMKDFMQILCKFGEIPSGRYQKNELCRWEKLAAEN